MVATALLAPLGVALIWYNSVDLIGLWFILATIALHVLYFNLLARSYAEGNLSLVYPVARGMGPMIVPALAVVFLSETIEPLAIGGIAAILGGIYTISWRGNFHQVLRRPFLFFSSAGMRYAMLIGLTIATYAIVDKEGIGHVQPLLYMYFF